MLKLIIALKGTQTESYCSISSGIGACEKLSRSSEKCLMYKSKLKYDWDAHSYKRCEECLKSELKEN